MDRVTAELRDSLIAGFGREALHLEMRDLYAAADHSRFRTWLAGEPLDPAAEEQWWRPWREMMRGHREAGRTLRRLRIVSEPVTDYIRFEWLDADELVKAGEDVRWLPRQRASGLLLPGNDLWSFDGETVAAARVQAQRTELDVSSKHTARMQRKAQAEPQANWQAEAPDEIEMEL
jgi:hypothetical protein